MKLTFLGTGAADWDINAYTPEAEFRRFSSALVNDDLLIDPGPHILHFAKCAGKLDIFDNVRNVIVTHTHQDHFCPQITQLLCSGGRAKLWGDEACMRALRDALGDDAAAKIDFEAIPVSQDPYCIGKYQIWSLFSNHEGNYWDEITRLYVIEGVDPAPELPGGALPVADSRMLFYGCDSAWLPTRSWNVIKNMPIDAMVMELTCGETAPNDWRIFEHNTLEMLKLMLETFRKYNYFTPEVKFYTSHMARTLHTSHAQLEETLRPLGVTPAFDGMVIDI
ncbi:MAG: hypothetical protein J5950_09195 [Clostridia bacterium]|nr:hypothetical protein [Clostridia bacterium]